jgi:hypothetical protein
MKPMTRAKESDFATMAGVRVKVKASSAKVYQFMVEMPMNA